MTNLAQFIFKIYLCMSAASLILINYVVTVMLNVFININLKDIK